MINGKRANILAFIFCICLCFSSCSESYYSTKEVDYENYVNEVVDAELFMPKLEELGDYESILITRKTPNDIFFNTTDSVALIIQYDEDVFDFVVDQLEDKYAFINSPLDNYLDYEAEVNNYYFRVDCNSLCEMISYPSGELVLEPKHSLIIGINIVENKISYLYYWDIEKQEMDNLDKFIEENFVLK